LTPGVSFLPGLTAQTARVQRNHPPISQSGPWTANKSRSEKSAPGVFPAHSCARRVRATPELDAQKNDFRPLFSSLLNRTRPT
jgi:hypothetical protein